MLRLMRERDEVRVVGDQIGTPTWATGIAQAIWGLIDSSPPPVFYHWTDLGVASWYDFAVAIQDEALARDLLPRAVPVTPISTANIRPRRSARHSACSTRNPPAPWMKTPAALAAQFEDDAG
jgi:dTDP-4-dehydrorhamnose reductase